MLASSLVTAPGGSFIWGAGSLWAGSGLGARGPGARGSLTSDTCRGAMGGRLCPERPVHLEETRSAEEALLTRNGHAPFSHDLKKFVDLKVIGCTLMVTPPAGGKWGGLNDQGHPSSFSTHGTFSRRNHSLKNIFILNGVVLKNHEDDQQF